MTLLNSRRFCFQTASNAEMILLHRWLGSGKARVSAKAPMTAAAIMLQGSSRVIARNLALSPLAWSPTLPSLQVVVLTFI